MEQTSEQLAAALIAKAKLEADGILAKAKLISSNDPHSNSGNTILKELSDIKSSLAVNTVETQNIKGVIVEIKEDVKDIKNDYMSRREYQEFHTPLVESVSELQSTVTLLVNFKNSLMGKIVGGGLVLGAMWSAIQLYITYHFHL